MPMIIVRPMIIVSTPPGLPHRSTIMPDESRSASTASSNGRATGAIQTLYTITPTRRACVEVTCLNAELAASSLARLRPCRDSARVNYLACARDSSVREMLAEHVQYRDLLIQMVRRDSTLRYKQTFMGSLGHLHAARQYGHADPCAHGRGERS